MARVNKAAVDFTVLDNGTVKFTATPVDAVGNPPNPPGLPSGTSTPVWSSSDATILAVAPDATDTTGLTAIGTPVGPLGTGVVVTVDAVLPDGTTHITGSGDPVDVVAGPAGRLTVQES